MRRNRTVISNAAVLQFRERQQAYKEKQQLAGSLSRRPQLKKRYGQS